MSDLLFAILAALVGIAIIAAMMIRNRSVQDFKKQQRANGFAQYVVETIHKQPHLANNHGFFIDPALSEHAVEALKKYLPQALVTVKGAVITLSHKQSTWVIPICTTEEYTELYI